MSEEITCPTCHFKNVSQDNYCKNCGALLKSSLIGTENTCPFCHVLVSSADTFCPSCGKKIREKPLSTTWMTQTWIYLISFFAPPLGLWPGFKYLRSNDQKAKHIGLVAVALTVAGILVAGYFAIQISNQVNEQVNKQLQELTF